MKKMTTTANLQTSIELKQSIQQICLRLLAMREHSQRELLDKLALRGYSRADVEPIITEFAEQGWQDNQRFAECYARQRMIKGYGPVRIRYELQQRGIAELDLEQLAEDNVGGWLNSLLQIYENKFDQQPKLSRAEWLKRSRFLQQRGFSHEMIKQMCAELKIKIA